MAILAQLGFAKKGKVEKGTEQNLIHGVVLRPQNDKPESLIRYAERLRRKCDDIEIYFDSEFSIFSIQGDVNLGKTSEYSFYPNATNPGSNYLLQELEGYIKGSVEFQKKLGVKSILGICPIIQDYKDRSMGTLSNIIELSLGALANEEAYHSGNFMISLCVQETAFQDIDSVNHMLDELTAWDVEGFYVVIDRNASAVFEPNIDEQRLANIMYFLYSLSVVNSYKVIVGYVNLLSVPYSAICNAEFAVGWFGKTRMFTQSGFINSKGGKRPKLRYLSEPLLSSVLVEPEIVTMKQNLDDSMFLSGSPFDNELKPESWSQEKECLEDWYALSSLTQHLQSEVNIFKRIDILQYKVNKARHILQEIEKVIPALDKKSNPVYLDTWEKALERFKEILNES